MKYLLLRTNCHINDVEIIKESQENKVFNSRNEIDDWLFYNNFNEEDFSILKYEESSSNLQTVFNRNIFKK